MTATDLMIGDWILMNSGPAKVISVSQDTIAFVDRFGRAAASCGDGLPLTPEILEKNGFKYTDNHTLQGSDTYILRYEQNGFDYTITYKLNDWFAVDSYDDRTYRIFEMETGKWCVHQLQHALRLCGIDKEIVI